MAAALLGALTSVVGCSATPSPIKPETAPSSTAISSPSDLTVREQLIALVVGDFATDEDVAEGRCFADTVMGEIGEDELVEAEVLLPGNLDGMVPRLPKKMVKPWVEAQFSCTNYVKQATREQAFDTNGQLNTAVYSACYREQITEEQGKEATRAALQRKLKGEAWARVSAAQDLCLEKAQTAG